MLRLDTRFCPTAFAFNPFLWQFVVNSPKLFVIFFFDSDRVTRHLRHTKKIKTLPFGGVFY